MSDDRKPYDAADHETFGFIDDEAQNEEGLEDDVLDADDYQEADKHGMTPLEEREGAPLDQQLAAEVPDDTDEDPGRSQPEGPTES